MNPIALRKARLHSRRRDDDTEPRERAARAPGASTIEGAGTDQSEDQAASAGLDEDSIFDQIPPLAPPVPWIRFDGAALARSLPLGIATGFVALFALLFCSAPIRAQAADVGGETVVYFFNAGRTIVDATVFGSMYSDRNVIELDVISVVVKSPNGVLMFDGGLGARESYPPEVLQPGSGIELEFTTPLRESLAAVGIKRIDILALSHLHADHVGAIAEFPDATVYVQTAEFELAVSAAADTTFGYVRNLYQGLVGSDRLRLIDGDHELLDGIATLLSLPGHSVGHQALLVQLASGPLLVTGDAVTQLDQLESRRVGDFHFDVDASVESIDRIRALIESTPNLRLLVPHDSRSVRLFPRPPGFIR